MGNCWLCANPPYLDCNREYSQKSIMMYSLDSIKSRIHAAEETLFIYNSTILRNSQSAQKDVDMLVGSSNVKELRFAIQKQKLYEAILLKIQEHREGLKSASSNIENKKKECMDILADTYLLIQDTEDLVELDDMFQGRQGNTSKTKEDFEMLFRKYVNGNCMKKIQRKTSAMEDDSNNEASSAESFSA